MIQRLRALHYNYQATEKSLFAASEFLYFVSLTVPQNHKYCMLYHKNLYDYITTLINYTFQQAIYKYVNFCEKDSLVYPVSGQKVL